MHKMRFKGMCRNRTDIADYWCTSPQLQPSDIPFQTLRPHTDQAKYVDDFHESESDNARFISFPGKSLHKPYNYQHHNAYQYGYNVFQNMHFTPPAYNRQLNRM